MRIIFMGTPEFAVASLDTIHSSEIEVAAVVTAPDRPAGRGRKLRPSAVKEYAREKGLPLLQPEKLRDTDFLDALRSFDADLFVVVAFRMLPRAVWDMPPQGTINLHASLLPDYRGAAPINWVIINGERKSGVTTFFIDENIDSGSVLLRKEVPIGEKETAGELHDKLMAVGAGLLLETIRKIRDKEIKAVPQERSSDQREAPKLNRENTHIDFTQDVTVVYNLIRGLSPYPAAHTTLLHKGEKFADAKIFKASISAHEGDNAPAGTVYTDNQKYIDVQCSNGRLRIEEIQIAGKRKMSSSDLLNGFDLPEGVYFA